MAAQEKYIQFIKEELSGWKPFEVIWLLAFIAAQVFAYVQNPASVLEMISGIAGIICVVLVSKGKISNYFFGLIFAYTYFYVAWRANFIGEMNSVLYIYLPSQFVEKPHHPRYGRRNRRRQSAHPPRLGNHARHYRHRHIRLHPSPTRRRRQLNRARRRNHRDYLRCPSHDDFALPRTMAAVDSAQHSLHRIVGRNPRHVSDVRRISVQLALRLLQLDQAHQARAHTGSLKAVGSNEVKTH